MNDLLEFAAHNTIAAFLLALVVAGVTRVWRHPPVAHVLWLLVLLRLVMPPLLAVEWSPPGLPSATQAQGSMSGDTPRVPSQQAPRHAHDADRTAPVIAAHETEHVSSTFLQEIHAWGRPTLLWLWLTGSALCALVAITRIVRFERLLRGTLPAPERLQQLASDIAGRLGVRRAPDVRCVESVDVPFVWWAGRRPTIVLPMHLGRQFDEPQVALILAHEIAHLRRRDHWVRVIELVVAAVYWWNPLAWAVRRRIHQAEDLCCDAWVRWAFPDSTGPYAEVVLKLAESLNAPRGGARLLPASPFLHSLSLKARIEMILESQFAPGISKKSLFGLVLFGLLALPAFVQTTGTEALGGGDEKSPAIPAGKGDSPRTSEFPHVLRFEQGATKFLNGDRITIVEVRGTADSFVPGNIYWIKGTYTLASHDRATVAAYITAMDAENGTNTPLTVQSTVVNRGDGTFTLFLPMSYRGWPHVSFYPADGGESFGGNYFGTGDSVLRKWWGSSETE
jgi:beta-lactamase regulating signal transducer with metallopeptidase domain